MFELMIMIMIVMSLVGTRLNSFQNLTADLYEQKKMAKLSMIFALKIMTSALTWISTHPMSWDLINAIVAYTIYAFKKYKG